jgi:hypothetical protein
MLMSAVPDPSAFDVSYFDAVYRIQAEDFLRGIERNGLLIVDSGKRIQNAIIGRITSLPIKYRQQLQIKIEELLLKKKTKRIIAITTSSNGTSPPDLLGLAYRLKTDTKVDALIVGDGSLKTLKSEQKHVADIVPLSEYRDSDFEADRQRYENKIGPIDTLPKTEVDSLVIRLVRFTKWLRFYDPQIGKGSNTSRFRKGIEYILSLWKDHGFFATQQGIGEVQIFTCEAEHIRDDETEHAKESKLKRNQENYRKIVRELIEPLKNQFPWPIELFVKSDPDGIFHARYLETQHAIISVERGFDLFKQNSGFNRNFFTLHTAASSHLKECRELLDANVGGST